MATKKDTTTRARLIACLLLSVGLSLTFMACGSSEGDSAQCPLGAEGCPCNGGQCFAALECLSNVCVDRNAPTPSPGSGGTLGTGGTTATGGSSGTGGGGSGDCEQGGGILLGDGACYKECVFDGEAAGNDLFSDCVPLRMFCSDRGFCSPRQGSCGLLQQTDCSGQPGFVCTWFVDSLRGEITRCFPRCENSRGCPDGTGRVCSTSRAECEEFDCIQEQEVCTLFTEF
ncbi:MAG: hypothetical protein AAF500_08315 [Myxococcota bacterium]